MSIPFFRTTVWLDSLTCSASSKPCRTLWIVGILTLNRLARAGARRPSVCARCKILCAVAGDKTRSRRRLRLTAILGGGVALPCGNKKSFSIRSIRNCEISASANSKKKCSMVATDRSARISSILLCTFSLSFNLTMCNAAPLQMTSDYSAWVILAGNPRFNVSRQRCGDVHYIRPNRIGGDRGTHRWCSGGGLLIISSPNAGIQVHRI